jgi:SpoVK/Ycf46/Vps4 family AAA+-type ATPase
MTRTRTAIDAVAATSIETELSLRHLQAELARIDVLLHREVRRWQLAGQDATDGFRGLYVTDAEADALLARSLGTTWGQTAILDPLEEQAYANAQAEAAQQAQVIAETAHRQGQTLCLPCLASTFGLDPFDVDALLICLAPELDLRYERIYGYLQDDVTKRRPSVDLVLNLLCPSLEAKLAMRQRFNSTAPLLASDLLSLFQDPSHRQPPLLSHYLKVDERIVGFLLNGDELDARLLPYARYQVPQAGIEDLLLPGDVKRRLVLLVREHGLAHRALILYFQGGYGVGKQSTAEALCRELGVGLLVIDGQRLLQTEDLAFEMAVRLAAREALLQGAALYWANFDALLAGGDQAHREELIRVLEGRRGLTFLAGEATWEPADALHDLPFVRVEFPRPAYGERLKLWALSLDGSTPPEGEVDLDALANKFRFSGGQIRDAAATARNLARWHDPENGHPTMADLYAACRLQSNRKLATLARKIEPHYVWDDIALPPDRLEQLREICSYVKYHAQVYDEWGFDGKLSLGKGLNVLFAGPSGTGKTMAAEIMANELALDLYKIDLSTVVSKYIGETEKNLARIFAEAETSNAILFFDEADALFGKRSEVRDSHDRYANIEISYLLQRMEEYEGIAILATNLRKNLDDAFVRRIHFTVEFPFPSEKYRRLIWEGIWPEDTPLVTEPSAGSGKAPSAGSGRAVDLGFMARRFELAGGNIRNVALAAAFLAADDGQVVDMGHLLRATRREYQKMGKVVTEGEFGIV